MGGRLWSDAPDICVEDISGRPGRDCRDYSLCAPEASGEVSAYTGKRGIQAGEVDRLQKSFKLLSEIVLCQNIIQKKDVYGTFPKAISD